MRISVEDLTGRLSSDAERAQVAVDRATTERLAGYVALLFRWNQRMNLTALNADAEGLHRLVVEPLLAARHIPRGAATVVDVGSGAGSPAIPLKIARPELFVRMVESRKRKAAFLREAIRRLHLVGSVVEDCRFEDLGDRPDTREAHDVLTVRGVRVDAGVARRLEALVRPGGLVLAFCSGGRGEPREDERGPLSVAPRHALGGTSRSELVVIRRGGLEQALVRRGAGG